MRNLPIACVFFIFLFFSHRVLSQTPVKLPEELMNKMADDACQCITPFQRDNPDGSPAEYNQKFMDCFSTVIVNRMDEILKHISTEEFSKNGRSIGVEVGKLILKRCPDFMKYSIKMAQANQEENKGLAAGITTGTIKRVEEKDFIYFVLSDESGKEISFLWLTYFKGSEELTENPARVKGKKATINWTEVECYLPKAKGYYKVKKIQRIEWL